MINFFFSALLEHSSESIFSFSVNSTLFAELGEDLKLEPNYALAVDIMRQKK
jgi:hypothetical protein